MTTLRMGPRCYFLVSLSGERCQMQRDRHPDRLVDGLPAHDFVLGPAPYFRDPEEAAPTPSSKKTGSGEEPGSA